VGFPIRRSSDHSSFAAPQGLSQRTTSFIASQRQGIHQMLFRHLIALMIHARRKGSGIAQTPQRLIRKTVPGSLQEHACRTQPAATAQRPKLVSGPKPQTGHVPSSRCQTPAGAPRAARESKNPLRTPAAAQPAWWSQTGSNRRPQACKARALPTELWPLRRVASGEGQANHSPLAIRHTPNGGPGTTRTSDLTLIRGAL
jgi:hypothetical protein